MSEMAKTFTLTQSNSGRHVAKLVASATGSTAIMLARIVKTFSDMDELTSEKPQSKQRNPR
jgi:hypothetical protein